MTDETTPQDSAAMPPASTGSVDGPLAWGVLPDDGLPLWRCSSRRQAEQVVEWLREQRHGSSPAVVPLVDGRSPALTDAEREAIERLCDAASDMIADDKRAGGVHWQADMNAVAVVRGLLERLERLT